MSLSEFWAGFDPVTLGAIITLSLAVSLSATALAMLMGAPLGASLAVGSARRGRSAIQVRVLAQGTGQALATAARGDADLVLVHDPEAEEQFVAAGRGNQRR